MLNKQEVNWHQEMSMRHAALDMDQHAETLFIRLASLGGTNLQQGERCYLSNVSRPIRRVTGIQNMGYARSGALWHADQSYFIASLGAQAALTITLVNPQGTRLIEDFPVSRLGWITPSVNFGGKVVRFDLLVDMQKSYLTYINPNPLTGVNQYIPLMFSFVQ